jgi:hydrogenase small subunit
MTQFAAKTINIGGCPPHSDWIVGTIAYLLARNLQALPPLEAYGRPIDYFGMYQCNAGPCEWRYNQGYKLSDETSQYANPKIGLTPNPVDANYGTPGNSFINSSKLYKQKWANSAETGLTPDIVDMRAVGCIGVLGCKGRKTKADCSLRRWNADAPLGANQGYGSGWCVASGAGCHGCTEPTFPDKVGKFFNFA